MTDVDKTPDAEKQYHYQVKLSPAVWALAEELRARLGLRSVSKLIERLINDAHESLGRWPKED